MSTLSKIVKDSNASNVISFTLHNYSNSITHFVKERVSINPRATPILAELVNLKNRLDSNQDSKLKFWKLTKHSSC